MPLIRLSFLKWRRLIEKFAVESEATGGQWWPGRSLSKSKYCNQHCCFCSTVERERESENKREFWDFYCCFGQIRSDQYVKTLSLSTSANSWAWLAGTHPPTAVSLWILTPFTLSEDNGGEQRIRKAINRGKQEVMIRWKPTGRVCGNKIELLLQFFGRACAPILSRVKILPVPAAGRIATVRWLIEANPGVGVKRLRPC